MAELDCRIVAMFALAVSLLFLGGVIFVRQHHHHNPGAIHRTSEALVVERDGRLCVDTDDSESASDEFSVEANETATSPSIGIDLHCLRCICEMVNGCKPSTCTGGEVCGPFRISQPYWIDAGQPTLDGEAVNIDGGDSKKAYLLCVNNPFCAARAVDGYMAKYARDCDGDGVIDCYDYAAIHMKGPRGCKEDELSAVAFTRLQRCLDMTEVLSDTQGESIFSWLSK